MVHEAFLQPQAVHLNLNTNLMDNVQQCYSCTSYGSLGHCMMGHQNRLQHIATTSTQPACTQTMNTTPGQTIPDLYPELGYHEN